MFIHISNFRPFFRTSGSKNDSVLGNQIDFKGNIFNSITCNFFPFTTLIKHGFQSEILRTVNSKSFLKLAKNYGTLHFKDRIQKCFRHYYYSGGSVTNTAPFVAMIFARLSSD